MPQSKKLSTDDAQIEPNIVPNYYFSIVDIFNKRFKCFGNLDSSLTRNLCGNAMELCRAFRNLKVIWAHYKRLATLFVSIFVSKYPRNFDNAWTFYFCGFGIKK